MTLRHHSRARSTKVEAGHAVPAAPLTRVLLSRRVWTFPFIASVIQVFVEYVRPQEKYDLLQGLPLGEASFALLILAVLTSGRELGISGSAGRWILPFLVWAFGASLLASNPSASLTAYGDVLKVVGIYFLLVAAIQNKEQLYVLVLWYMAIAFLHTNFSFRMWAVTGFVGAGGGAYVGSGFLQNPNDYGAALAALWGLSLGLAVHDHHSLGRIPMKWIHRGNTALFLVGVLTSSSRGAAVAVLAGALFYLAVAVPGGKKKIAFMGVIAGMVIGFLALLSESQSARFEDIGGAQDESAEDRRRTWRVARMVIADNPVVGVGVGQFLPEARRYPAEGPIFVQHNIVLQAGSDLGLPGLALLAAIIWGFYLDQKQVMRRLRARPDPMLKAIGVGLNVSMFSFLVAGQFITVLFYPFLWTLLVVSGVLYRVTEVPRARLFGKQPLPAGVP
ncbi:MAG: O-antigen ligase family protein [Gemmatimonadota bacterium]